MIESRRRLARRHRGMQDPDVFIIQRVIPHYRIALFQELYERTGARVITADTPPGGTFLNFADPHEHAWAVPMPFRFPDPNNAFRAEVPLDQIIEVLRPRSLVAEFGVRLSSTRQLPRARNRGQLASFAYWTHGWQMERGFSTPGDFLIQHLRLRMLAQADALGAYSEEGARWLRRQLPRTPVVTLGNALDPSAIRAAAQVALPRHNASPQLLGVGRLTADKRFDLLIEIFRQVRTEHPRAALTIIGDGPERDRLERQAGTELGAAIQFTGPLHDEAELAPHFIGADLMVIPGAAGLAVNHALAYGLPVVAFARSARGPRHHPEIEYVAEGRSGILVREPDPAAMARRISDAVRQGEHRTLREALQAGSPAPSIAQVAEQFEELFATLEKPAIAVGSPQQRASCSAEGSDARAAGVIVSNKRRVAFLWDNFGPMHNDRCAAVAERLGAPDAVLGIELFGASDTYQWRADPAEGFRKVTLFPAGRRRPWWRVAVAIVDACRRAGVSDAFFCHYERPEVFVATVILRALGVRVFTMMDSKYDDYPRYLWRELGKRFGHTPYAGALAAGERARDYLRFLGHRPDRIETGYNAISIARIRRLAAATSVVKFADRDFLIVARLVPKKNIATAIEAFRIFAAEDLGTRKLRVCGAGPLEQDLKTRVAAVGLAERVIFHGFEQIEIVAQRMAAALALLVPSTEEQFGLVVSEAVALSLPVIVSTACGARDDLVRSAVNGFIVEPDNAAGLAAYMALLSADAALWERMRRAADSIAPQADVGRFVAGVERLTGRAA